LDTGRVGHRTAGGVDARQWTLDGWTPAGRTAGPSDDEQVAGHRTGWTPDGWTAGPRTTRPDGWTPDAGHRPATDAMAGVLAVSTRATTPDRWMSAGRSASRRHLGKQQPRTAQQQGLRGHHAATNRLATAGRDRQLQVIGRRPAGAAAHCCPRTIRVERRAGGSRSSVMASAMRWPRRRGVPGEHWQAKQGSLRRRRWRPLGA
jgi:hypothetical protein